MSTFVNHNFNKNYSQVVYPQQQPDQAKPKNNYQSTFQYRTEPLIQKTQTQTLNYFQQNINPLKRPIGNKEAKPTYVSIPPEPLIGSKFFKSEIKTPIGNNETKPIYVSIPPEPLIGSKFFESEIKTPSNIKANQSVKFHKTPYQSYSNKVIVTQAPSFFESAIRTKNNVYQPTYQSARFINHDSFKKNQPNEFLARLGNMTNEELFKHFQDKEKKNLITKSSYKLNQNQLEYLFKKTKNFKGEDVKEDDCVSLNYQNDIDCIEDDYVSLNYQNEIDCFDFNEEKHKRKNQKKKSMESDETLKKVTQSVVKKVIKVSYTPQIQHSTIGQSLPHQINKSSTLTQYIRPNQSNILNHSLKSPARNFQSVVYKRYNFGNSPKKVFQSLNPTNQMNQKPQKSNGKKVTRIQLDTFKSNVNQVKTKAKVVNAFRENVNPKKKANISKKVLQMFVPFVKGIMDSKVSNGGATPKRIRLT